MPEHVSARMQKENQMPRILALATALAVWNASAAQDLIVTNARIIDGTGQTIEGGSVVVTDGRIVAVGPELQSTGEVPAIDADGMTLMPGMMDTHWHVLSTTDASDEAIDQYIEDVVAGVLDTVLAWGMTTIMGAGDHFPNIVELRRRLADGEIRGPRLLTVGPVFTAPGDWSTQTCDGVRACEMRRTAQLTTPEEARAKVREVAAAGVDAIKIVYDDIRVPDVRLADEVIAAITYEAKQHDLVVLAHVSTVEETALKLVDLGVRGFVHPVTLLTSENRHGVEILRDLQIPVATTISGPSREWRDATGREYPESAAIQFNRRLEDIRYLWEGGVTLAFGTDASSGRGDLAGARFMAEARALSQVLPNHEVIATLTRNAAILLGLEDDLGTIEPGKIADLVLIDGDPIADISDLANVKVVVQGGRVVVDKR